MFRMSSSPSGRGPGASDYWGSSAASSVGAPVTVGVSPSTPSPRGRSTNRWGDHQAVIGRADVKDDRATQGERRAAGRRLKYKWSAVKLASTGEDNELKQAHASGQTAVDRSRALSPASQEALLQQREQRSIVGTQNASQPERSPSLGRVPDDLVTVAKDAVIPPRKATKPHDATTSVEHNLPNSFKEFSAAEKLRVAEHYQSIACGNKAVKLNELKRFALNFKLSTSIPADLVPVLAKDEIKQGAIVQKALKQATAGEHSGFVHELDKKLQEDCKRAFDQPLQERLRAARHAAEQSREAKDVHARPIANEESATPRGKQASTGNPIDILHISDLSHQFSPITSMAYDDLDPRYLEDGLTWNSDTLGIRDPGFDDGSELASALGSDNCKYVERPMRKDFDDDSEASLSRSSTPDGYTPTSGSDNECAPSKSVTDTEFPVRSESSEMSFKQALQVFNLGDYLSVDMSLLHERLEHRLFSGDCDHVVIASAFTTIVKHQHETKSWTVRLDWDDDGDHFLLDDHIGTHHDKWANTAHEFDTTQDDCWQRWANLKPKDWEPKSACKCSITGDVSCCCCSGETWTPNLDDKLVSLKADNCSWADIASRFWYFNEEDCKTRFKRIKPKGWKPNSKKQNTKQKTTATRNQREQQEIATAEITAKVESIADEDAAPDFWCGRSWGRPEWTADEDTRLVNLRWQNCIWWEDIAADMNKTVEDCKHRFNHLTTWNTSNASDTESPMHANNSGWYISEPEMSLSEAYSFFEIHRMSERAEINLSALRSQMLVAPPGESAKLEKAYKLIREDQAQNYPWSITAEDQGEKIAAGKAKEWTCGCKTVEWCACNFDDSSTRPCGHPDDGWDCGCCVSCGALKGSPHCGCDGHPPSPFAPKTEPAPYIPPTVTYWATIESGGKEIHVPIDSKHVSGPEKNIATSRMEKVWRWIHDKGLGDKISLQDAFDLAQSMHKEESTGGVKDQRVTSRAESVLSDHTESETTILGVSD